MTPLLTTSADTGASPVAAEDRAEELRFLVQSGRLRHWQRGVTETLVRAGLSGSLPTVEEWAATSW